MLLFIWRSLERKPNKTRSTAFSKRRHETGRWSSCTRRPVRIGSFHGLLPRGLRVVSECKEVLASELPLMRMFRSKLCQTFQRPLFATAFAERNFTTLILLWRRFEVVGWFRSRVTGCSVCGRPATPTGAAPPRSVASICDGCSSALGEIFRAGNST